MKRLTKEYLDYLQSLQWAMVRRGALERCGHKCQRCGSTVSLEVHHKHYETFGREQPEDVEVLCIPCHEKADEERHEKAEADRYHAARNTWATKKYGEDWTETEDFESVSEEFREWLERKREEY